MSEADPNPELMRSLGRLMRGLSALFWGLPVALVVCFHTAKAEGFQTFGVVPPLACTGLLVYGLWLMAGFQRQERVWRSAVDRARYLALINFGVSPFLYWWNRMPENNFFLAMVGVSVAGGLLFLAALNFVLRRLGAMLPDEALRLEIRQFTGLNLNLLLATLILSLGYLGLSRVPKLPLYFQAVMMVLDRGSLWLVVLLVLLPLAMTMALLWKTKEVIFENVFGTKH